MRIAHIAGSESGATLAIVAITMMALFGMTVLVVDVGGLLTAKRRMVAASDSAALAAAQSCARMQGPLTAKNQADFYATQNVAGATAKTPIALSPASCGMTKLTSSEGSVSVAYTVAQALYFGPVLGTDDEASVLAEATAIWGPTGRAVVTPVELTLDAGTSRFTCTDVKQVGDTCAYYYDNNSNNLTSSSNWGFMNLDTWPESEADNDPNARCNDSGAKRMGDWLTGDVEVEGRLYPTHTYVCVDRGGPGNSPAWRRELKSREGDLLYFPINDPDEMVLHPPGKAKFAIVGFAPLVLEQVLIGTEASGSTADAGVCSSPPVTLHEDDEYDISSLMAQCEIANDPDAVFEPPTLKRPNGAPIPQPGHWEYDADDNEIQWEHKKSETVTIEVTWQRSSQASPCGVHEPDPNAVCIVARWDGPKLAGGDPILGGSDFGLRAVRLSETKN